MPHTILLIEMFALLVAIGGLAGVLAGLLGVGGGIVLVPAFFFAFNGLGYGGPQTMQVCLATSLATIVITSTRSVLAHNRKGNVDWEILKGWAPGIMIGAILGLLTASSLKSHSLQVIFGSLALVIGVYMIVARSDWRLAEAMPRGLKRYAFSPLVGFLSVLMGIGGGSFGVPLMTLHGVAIHRAVATAAGFGVAIGLPSAIGFLFMTIEPGSRPPLSIGAVNLPAFAVVIAMTMMTAPLGVRLANAMDPKPLKRVFGGFLILVALNMLREVLLG